jgi:Tol biopolymer transport system component
MLDLKSAFGSEEGRRQQVARLLLLAAGIALWARGGQCGIARDIEPQATWVAGKGHCPVFSPDGKTLAFMAGREGVKLWDIASRKERLTLKYREDRNGADCMAFSPDGKTIAQASYCDRESGKMFIRLADAATGKEHSALLSKIVYPYMMAFAPDGKTLAVAGDSGEVWLWDLESRKVRATLSGHHPGASRVTFSPDGKILATSVSFGSEVFLWDAATGKRCHTCKFEGTNSADQWNIAFSPDGKTLAVGSEWGAIIFLNPQTGKRRAILRAPDGTWISELAFSPDGRVLAAVVKYDIYLWEVATAKKRWSFYCRQASRLAFSPDSRTLALECSDRLLLCDPASVKGNPPKAEELPRLWATLRSDDAVVAYRAIRTLTAFPAQTLPYLRQQMKPISLSESLSRKIDRWLVDLDSDIFTTRQKANEELQKCDVLAEGALRRALAARPSLEFRKRASALLEGIERRRAVEHLQQLRALEVLEHIGTAEARGLLAELAKGVPEARLTQEAKASLARLAKHPAITP